MHYTNPESTTPEKTIVLDIPIDKEQDTITLHLLEAGDIIKAHASNVLDHTLYYNIHPSSTSDFSLLPWIRNNAKVTVFLSSIPSPQKSVLRNDPSTDTCLNRAEKNLPNYHLKRYHLLTSKLPYQHSSEMKYYSKDGFRN